MSGTRLERAAPVGTAASPRRCMYCPTILNEQRGCNKQDYRRCKHMIQQDYRWSKHMIHA
eukprot:2565991-Pleurochrysis_carterae.AAC.1